MECLGREGVGNPSIVALTTEAVVMASTSTVEGIRTILISRKRNRVFRRQTSALEYVV